MLLPYGPWIQQGWALPFRMVLSPSEHFYEQRNRQQRPMVERAWQPADVSSAGCPEMVQFFRPDMQAGLWLMLRRREELWSSSPPLSTSRRT
jgi:hypothetical protein